jgi:hypothetical protein
MLLIGMWTDLVPEFLDKLLSGLVLGIIKSSTEGGPGNSQNMKLLVHVCARTGNHRCLFLFALRVIRSVLFPKCLVAVVSEAR